MTVVGVVTGPFRRMSSALHADCAPVVCPISNSEEELSICSGLPRGSKLQAKDLKGINLTAILCFWRFEPSWHSFLVGVRVAVWRRGVVERRPPTAQLAGGRGIGGVARRGELRKNGFVHKNKAINVYIYTAKQNKYSCGKYVVDLRVLLQVKIFSSK